MRERQSDIPHLDVKKQSILVLTHTPVTWAEVKKEGWLYLVKMSSGAATEKDCDC